MIPKLSHKASGRLIAKGPDQNAGRLAMQCFTEFVARGARLRNKCPTIVESSKNNKCVMIVRGKAVAKASQNPCMYANNEELRVSGLSNLISLRRSHALLFTATHIFVYSSSILGIASSEASHH